MKVLILFFFYFTSHLAFAQSGAKLSDLRARHKEMIDRIQKQLEADHKSINRIFDDQFFKQADQMFKQISDGKDPFSQIIQKLGNSFEASQAPSQWLELQDGMAFILPFILGPKDEMKLDIKGDSVELKIERWRGGAISDSQNYQFPTPEGCDASAVQIITEDSKTQILFPWLKKLQKVSPKSSDKRI